MYKVSFYDRLPATMMKLRWPSGTTPEAFFEQWKEGKDEKCSAVYLDGYQKDSQFQGSRCELTQGHGGPHQFGVEKNTQKVGQVMQPPKSMHPPLAFSGITLGPKPLVSLVCTKKEDGTLDPESFFTQLQSKNVQDSKDPRFVQSAIVELTKYHIMQVTGKTLDELPETIERLEPNEHGYHQLPFDLLIMKHDNHIVLVLAHTALFNDERIPEQWWKTTGRGSGLEIPARQAMIQMVQGYDKCYETKVAFRCNQNRMHIIWCKGDQEDIWHIWKRVSSIVEILPKRGEATVKKEEDSESATEEREAPPDSDDNATASSSQVATPETFRSSSSTHTSDIHPPRKTIGDGSDGRPRLPQPPRQKNTIGERELENLKGIVMTGTFTNQ